MTRHVDSYSFSHSVTLGREVICMNRLMDKILQFDGRDMMRDLLPTLIRVKLPKNCGDDRIVAMRKFMATLRLTQREHFVRFVVDDIWVANTFNCDIMHSTHKHSRAFYDATIDVRFDNPKIAELTVTIPIETRQSAVLESLSNILNCRFDIYGDTRNVVSAKEAVLEFYNDKNLGYFTEQLSEPFHLIFIPDRKHQQFTPVPIWNLTRRDALRRYSLSTRGFGTLVSQYSDFFPNAVETNELMLDLIQAIQDLNERSTHSQANEETYALAELLYSYYAAKVPSTTRNDVLVFDSTFVEKQEVALVTNVFA